MYKVKLINNIKSSKLEIFDKTKYEVGAEIDNPDAIMLRSAKIHDMEFNPELLCIARAGAGVNNIPIERCAEQGIVVFNTPGANSGAVKELVICALFLSSRDILGGIDWVKTIADESDEVPALIEKQKSKYTGPEISGKVLGLIGLGAIGGKVAKAAAALGMEVLGFDPYLSEETKKELSGYMKIAESIEEIYKNSDFITLNLPCTADTKHFIGKNTIGKMKQGVRVINAARAELVNDDDMLAALESGQVSKYVTDFPNAKTAGAKGVIAIPHLGASTPESEDNCVGMAAHEIIEYIENGNIINSVNFDNLSLERTGSPRISFIHKNTPEVIAKIKSALSSSGISADNMLSADSKDKSLAYTIIDVSSLPDKLIGSINDIEGVVRGRSLV